MSAHIAVELRVACPIHLTHAAFADLGGDFIDAEPGVRAKLLRGLYGRDGSADRITPHQRRSVDRIPAPGPRGPQSSVRTR